VQIKGFGILARSLKKIKVQAQCNHKSAITAKQDKRLGADLSNLGFRKRNRNIEEPTTRQIIFAGVSVFTGQRHWSSVDE